MNTARHGNRKLYVPMEWVRCNGNTLAKIISYMYNIYIYICIYTYFLHIYICTIYMCMHI